MKKLVLLLIALSVSLYGCNLMVKGDGKAPPGQVKKADDDNPGKAKGHDKY